MSPETIRILGIAAGHRLGRNTAWLVRYGLKVVETFGRRLGEVAKFETEFVDIADKGIKPCVDCDVCHRLPYQASVATRDMSGFRCVIQDDYLARELIGKMAEADGYFFGAPTFTALYPSRMRIFLERLAGWQWTGWFTNKPMAAATAGLATIGGGQDTCLNAINNCASSLGMMPVAWMHGAGSTCGPPIGPNPAEDDGKVIAVKQDRVVRYTALVEARRVAEVALMQKLARRGLGNVYQREFVQVYPGPHGDASWEWTELDATDEADLTRRLSRHNG